MAMGIEARMTTRFVSHSGWIGADTCMERGLPWIRPGATAFIESSLPEGASCFEWGSGASTIWLARRGYCVTSCELDHSWWYAINQKLLDEGLLHEVDLLDFSRDTMQYYADYILKSSDNSFDFILVDGRNRQRCLGNARSKVKVGGIVCLDNSEREEYNDALKLMESWDGYSFGDDGWLTTVFLRLLESEVERVEFPNADA
jgi:hypothetical protein